MSAVTDLSAYELRQAIAGGEITAGEATRTYLQEVERQNPTIRAFNEVFSRTALEDAGKIDRMRSRGEPLPPLAGLPLAVKDNLCTLNGHTTCSSRILSNFKAPYRATVISKLEEAGAVILGKTNMDEFAMGSSTENSCNGPTRNPWNPEHVPGGSSGGSAAAVSSRQCAAAIGSDTGGSIRQPAAFCGVVGLKPTYGRVSRYGLVAYGSSLDQIGPLTGCVKDCAMITRVLAGYDPMDSTSVNRPVPDYMARIEEPISDLIIGLPAEFYTDALDDEIRARLEEAVRIFEASGARTVQVHLPHSRIDVGPSGALSSYAVACYYIIAMAEASSNLSRYDGVHYGLRTGEEVGDIIELYSKTRSEGFGSEVKRRIMLGTYALSSGYYDAYYLKALKVRRLIKSDFDEALKHCHVLLCPVSPATAFKIGENISDPLTMYLEDIYTLSLNLAGLPGLALPCGLSSSGLPIGMQLLGPIFSEETLLRAARMYEKESGIYRLDPNGKKDGSQAAMEGS
ncbi:MAG TPA: Asp-tRNA(Asn)/Glu-tRNA(Gln) amidotransferase subunit GatA [Spirochaetia bacterium]|nr:Asp-tRNA(Asn)/Glu-tRNA(Gln) amidotransferase subunit GatA [Spirochaetia bacterium]